MTTFLHYSQDHEENNLMLLCSLTVYWSTVEWLSDYHAWRWVALGAFAAGWNLLIRITTILDFAGVLPLTALMVWNAKGAGREPNLLRRLRPVVLIALPILLAAGITDRLYHFYRFGAFTGTYMDLWARQQRIMNPALPPNYPYSVPFLTGFFGPLFSARKSIFLFDPTIIFAVGGLLLLLPAARRQRFAAARAFLTAAGIQLLAVIAFHARLVFWAGDLSWGDRYISVPVQLMCLVGIAIAAESWSELRFPAAP